MYDLSGGNGMLCAVLVWVGSWVPEQVFDFIVPIQSIYTEGASADCAGTRQTVQASLWPAYPLRECQPAMSALTLIADKLLRGRDCPLCAVGSTDRSNTF